MTPATGFTTHITLAPEPASVRQARQFVADQLREHDLAALVDDVGLVASELTTNAVRYARSPVTVGLESCPRDLRLTVSDDSALNPVKCEPSVWDVSGRGLTIVAAVSEAWGVGDGVTDAKTVWASFPVPG